MINKSAAIIIKDRSVLYLRKKDFLFWILPGGKIEAGETPEQALEREMMEELSTKIKVIEDLGLVEGVTFDKKLEELTPIKMHLYQAESLDEIKYNNEITGGDYITYKNIHRFLMTPIGIKTVKFLFDKGLID